MNLQIYVVLLSATTLAQSVVRSANVSSPKNAMTTHDDITDLNNQLNNAVYKMNFNDILTEYVLSQYRGLTFGERAKVQGIIEDLLEHVAAGFRSVLNDHDAYTERIVTRIGDPVFEKIHKYIVLGISGVDEYDALRLAYALESDLIDARQRIDRVISESKIALIHNS